METPEIKENKVRWSKKNKTPEEIEAHNKEVKNKTKNSVKQNYKNVKLEACNAVVNKFNYLRDILIKCNYNIPEMGPIDDNDMTVLKVSAKAFNKLFEIFEPTK